MSTVLNPSITRATTLRVLRQLRADPRTIAMIVVVPTALLTLMYFLYRDSPAAQRCSAASRWSCWASCPSR